MKDEKRYQAYLLRLQKGKGQLHWRATLQNAHTGETLKFATEREFFHHLIRILDHEFVDLDVTERRDVLK